MTVASKNLEYCLDFDKYNDTSDLLKLLQEKKKKKGKTIISSCMTDKVVKGAECISWGMCHQSKITPFVQEDI